MWEKITDYIIDFSDSTCELLVLYNHKDVIHWNKQISSILKSQTLMYKLRIVNKIKLLI